MRRWSSRGEGRIIAQSRTGSNKGSCGGIGSGEDGRIRRAVDAVSEWWWNEGERVVEGDTGTRRPRAWGTSLGYD
jgi:hypothetical protein